jgi:4-amino-4-deoxy-L-arabinose transferase-like glycosyltransferase
LTADARRLAAAVVVLWIVLFALGLGNHQLRGAEEPYVGGIIREMADSHDWVVPTLNGSPYLEKPPLYYLVGALAARVTGSFQPWVLRLPSALFALATMGYLAWFGHHRGRPAAGWWAAACTGTSDLFSRIGGTAMVDMPLVFGVTLGLGSLWLMLQEPDRARRWASWAWVGIALAFLGKGLIGPCLILLPVPGLAWAYRGSFRALLRPRWGMVLALAIAGLWCVLLGRRGGWPYLEEALLRNSLGRFLQSPALAPHTGTVGEHREHFYFYFLHTPLNLLPWIAFPFLAGFATRPGLPAAGRNPVRLFVPWVVICDLLLLSFSGMRRNVYALPLLPLAFLFAALFLDARLRTDEEAGQDPPASVRVSLGATALVVVLAVAIAPWPMAHNLKMPGWTPLPFTLLALASAAIFAWAWRARKFRWLLDGAVLLWAAGLTLPGLFTPPYEEPTHARLTQPFEWALACQTRTGAEVWASGFTESDLGMASLILRKPVNCLPEGLPPETILARNNPVVLLAPPQTAAMVGGAQILKPSPGASGKQGQPFWVVLNAAAAKGLAARGWSGAEPTRGRERGPGAGG